MKRLHSKAPQRVAENLGHGLMVSPRWACYALGVLLASYMPAMPAAQKGSAAQDLAVAEQEKDWVAEVVAAEDRVREERSRKPPQPLSLAQALAGLGTAQLGARNYAAAEEAFVAALKLLDEHAANPTAPEYLEPLSGLGFAMAATRRHHEAISHLDRALHIAHRTYGLMDLRQQDIREQLANSLVAIGRPTEGERHIKYLQTIGERTYGARDAQLAPILCRIAQWYAEATNYLEARTTYREAIHIVEDQLGNKSLALIEPLRGLAHSYIHEVNRPPRERTLEVLAVSGPDDWTGSDYIPNPRNMSAEGERALRRALKIIEADAEASSELLVDTLIQLGDWYQVKHQPRRSLDYYKRALEAAHERGITKDLFAFPVRVYFSTPMSSVRNLSVPDELVDQKYVNVEFTVDVDGSVKDAKVQESTANGRLTSQALDAVEDARYRPRFVDGEPVPTEALTHRQVFRTRKSSRDEEDTSG